MKKIKVLSLLQPWASLCVIPDAKGVETRCWNISDAMKELLELEYNNEIHIHSSLGKYYGSGPSKVSCRELCYKEPFSNFIAGGKGYDQLPFGYIIGKVNLGETFQFGSDRSIEYVSEIGLQRAKQEFAFGDWTEGRFGFVFSDQVEFAAPIKAKGALNLWDYGLPDHIHVPNQICGHATFSAPPTAEELDAVNKMAELAYRKL